MSTLRRLRTSKLAAWLCLIAVVALAASDWSASALTPPAGASLGVPENWVLPAGCFGAPPLPRSLALPSDAGRAPPLS